MKYITILLSVILLVIAGTSCSNYVLATFEQDETVYEYGTLRCILRSSDALELQENNVSVYFRLSLTSETEYKCIVLHNLSLTDENGNVVLSYQDITINIEPDPVVGYWALLDSDYMTIPFVNYIIAGDFSVVTDDGIAQPRSTIFGTIRARATKVNSYLMRY